MKNIKFLILLVFLATFSAKSQTIYEVLEDDTLNFFQKVSQIESLKDGASKGITTIDSNALTRYNRYVTFWDSRIDQTGNTFSFINETKSYFIEPTSDIAVNWDNITPRHVVSGGDSAHYQGRVQSIEVVIKGSDTIIYAGGSNGGLWKSTDGGATYQHKTPNIFGGVYKIAVHPTNKDTLFIACGMYANGLLKHGKYGAGVFRSCDAGETWNPIYPCEQEDMMHFQDIIFDQNNPDNIYAVTLDKIIQSSDLGDNWDFMQYENTDNAFSEIDINSLNSNQMLISGNGIMRWNNNTEIWEDISDNLYDLDTIFDVKIGSSTYNNEFYLLMYYKLAADSTKHNMFVKTSDYGNNFELLSDKNISASYYVLCFEIASNGKFYGGGVNMKKASSPFLSSSFPSIDDGLHSDVRDICFPDPTNPNLIYAATDGGIGMTKNGNKPWINITGDLALHECYAVATSLKTPDIIYTVTHDNGGYKRY